MYGSELEKLYLKRRKSWPLIILSFLAVNLCVTLISISIGSANIPITEVLSILSCKAGMVLGFKTQPVMDEAREAIIFQVRMPRTFLASLVGGSLAIAGTVFQGIFRNPMADPYVIGVSSGAAVGASFAIVLGIGYDIFGASIISVMAFIFAIASLFLVYSISKVGQRIPVMTLLLSGVAVSIFLSAVVSLLHIVAGEKLHSLVFWLMGSFSYSEWVDVHVILPFTCLSFFAVYIFARDLNILQLSEEEAAYLGVEVEKVKRYFLIFGSLLTASAVSVSGLIGFVGLIIPHIIRLVVGPDHRILLPSALIVGSTFLMMCDVVARVVAPPTELPVGVITAFTGVPFFIYLLRKAKGKYFFTTT
ncbi:MAG: FecCD family ABC transporter permease [Candidatus Bathyarchaeota archaeon]